MLSYRRPLLIGIIVAVFSLSSCNSSDASSTSLIQSSGTFDSSNSEPITSETSSTTISSQTFAPITIDGVTYSYRDDEQGYYADGYDSNDALITIVASILGQPVLGITTNAFAYVNSITSLVISEGVISIESGAFYQCSLLATLDIPDTIVRVGYQAFEGTAWQHNQPDGLVYVGKVLYTYKGSAPENISNIRGDTLAIGDYAFLYQLDLESIVIPTGVILLGHGAFEQCFALSNIILPNTLTEIGQFTFASCEALVTVAIPDSVITIDNFAFQSCTSLTTIDLSNTLLALGDSVFYGCYALISISIPASVTSIGQTPFIFCYNLAEIIVEASSSNYQTIEGGLYTKPINELITYPSARTGDTFAIAVGTTIINSFAFSEASNLVMITMDNQVLEIGENTFYKCVNLVNITLSNNLTYIPTQAFAHCASLVSIVIPDSVTTIDYEAFYYCDALTQIHIGAGVTTLDIEAFAECPALAAFTVASANQSLKALDGVLFNKEGTTLLLYPIGRPDTSYTLPTATLQIGPYSFVGVRFLTHLISNGLLELIGHR